MAPIAWSDVVNHDSTLASVNAGQQADLIALANRWFNVSLLDGEDGPRTKLARIYVAAHFAALPGSGQQGPAGPVTSESRGGLSRSYAAPGGDGSVLPGWNLTVWGRKYIALVRTSAARWPTVA